MARLEELTRGATVQGILPDAHVTVIDARWIGSVAVELTYKGPGGQLGSELLYREREPTLAVVTQGSPWSFDGDACLFRLAAEAQRIRLAYLFDPLLAVHTSLVEPLPHQITAVYGEMLPRQPLRFLLADDPGAGKTIMAGLFIKELMLRGDLHRCLIVTPGSLAEQWQDELDSRFHLPFEILTNDRLEAARTGNAFAEASLAIARLDKLSRNDDLQAKLRQTDWDLIVVDEAHKMSATYFGNEVSYTRRYHLGQMLSGLTRHFLLLTATPHNGKETDFQLFMALLDGDRFEGKFRDGTHQADASDLMRRLVKEHLLKFDGTPLFPERIARTATYKLSDAEADLYKEVTEYVREEFNHAEQLEKGRKGTVGFALTILQRRLASSPEAIYQSLRRRRERLEKRLREETLLRRAGGAVDLNAGLPSLDSEDLDEMEDGAADEVETAEEAVVDQASAARTIAELQTEIATLRCLEEAARKVQQSGNDRKWEELSRLLQNDEVMCDAEGHRRKLVIFTEHRDTLTYLEKNIAALLGRPEAVVTIHGGVGREQRRKVQERFTQDRAVEVLVATDAAGEGINLQRAHLMVNYDLPWNPNRLEQRFGRIHRIGQTEVCHLWNLVARETREGDVYLRLLEKLDEERQALGGQVFDVLGQLRFEDRPLRELLLEAVRYGDQPDVRARLYQVVDQALDRRHLTDLLEGRALAHDSMDVSKVRKAREDMERAEARRLQPHYVGSFFLEAFRHLGGTVQERESKRYEVRNVPASVRNRDRQIGRGESVLNRYERITFEKSLISVQGKPLAAFVCPGHPLLDATLDLVLERHRDLLRRGTVLVDEGDPGEAARALVFLEHTIQDAHTDRAGRRRVVSRRLQFIEIGEGAARDAGAAPYLDYRPPTEAEAAALARTAAPGWARAELEARVVEHAIAHLVPGHLAEVRQRKEELVLKTRAAVHERLTKEINYWDHRARQLKDQEEAGQTNARLNSGLARQRADDLATRLQKRLAELEQERQLSAQPPVVLGGAMVVPGGLLRRLLGPAAPPAGPPDDTTVSERLAVHAVLEAERRLGNSPRDVGKEKRGYDVESATPTGRLRFIEVKGRAAGADTVTLTRNEVLTGLNKPEDFVLAIAEIEGGRVARLSYVRRPFGREPDFGVTSVDYALKELLARGSEPG